MTNTGGLYDPATDTWTPTSTVGAPPAREGHTAVWTGSKMIVWGGFGRPGGPSNTGGLYDPATDTWTPTSTVGAPTARGYHTAVWTGSKMIVWGGWDAGGLREHRRHLRSGHRHLDADEHRRRSHGRAACHTAVWTGSKMIVWGGRDAPGPTNTGGSYDPATRHVDRDEHRRGSHGARLPHGGLDGVEDDRLGWAVTGTGTTATNTGGIYNPNAPSGWSGLQRGRVRGSSLAASGDGRAVHVAAPGYGDDRGVLPDARRASPTRTGRSGRSPTSTATARSTCSGITR